MKSVRTKYFKTPLFLNHMDRAEKNNSDAFFLSNNITTRFKNSVSGR